MGLLGELVLLPLAPVRIALWSAETVADEAMRQRRDQIRAELIALEQELNENRISAEEFDLREDDLLDELEQLAQQ